MSRSKHVFFAALLVALSAFRPVHAETGPEAYWISGNSRLAAHDYRAAIADFTEVLKLDDKAVGAYHGRGIAKMKSGERQGAIEDFLRVIDMQPELAKALCSEECREGGPREGHTRTIDLYRLEACDLTTAYGFAFDNRGLLKYMQGDFSGAVEDFTAAIALQPRAASFYKHRGYARYDSRDFPGAIADYSRSIELDGKSAETYRERGLAKEQAGDMKGAVDDFRKAARLGDNSAVKKLEQLEAESSS